MIDFKRVTPRFVFAYVKWAIPMVVCFVLFVVSLNFMFSGLAERHDATVHDDQEISRLNNKLATLQAEEKSENDSSPAVVDEAQVSKDQTRLNKFIDVYFNYDGEEQEQERLKQLNLEFNPEQDPSYSPGELTDLDSATKVSLVNSMTFCQTVSGKTSTWFCFFNLMIDDQPKQMYATINVGENTVSIQSGRMVMPLGA